VRPSTQRRAFAPLAVTRFAAAFEGRPPEANLAGFAPLDGPGGDFVDGMETLGGAGSPTLRRGFAVHRYLADRDREGRAVYGAAGDLPRPPARGARAVMPALGPLEVAPGPLALLPRGLLCAVRLPAPRARGYVAEAFGRPFRLPERGPVGANGLA